jgi:hypothetical protein
MPSEPGVTSSGGRGLWLIKRICPGLVIETGPAGTLGLLDDQEWPGLAFRGRSHGKPPSQSRDVQSTRRAP